MVNANINKSNTDSENNETENEEMSIEKENPPKSLQMIASVKELWGKANLPKDIVMGNLLIDLISNEEILKSRAHYELIISVINNIIP